MIRSHMNENQENMLFVVRLCKLPLVCGSIKQIKEVGIHSFLIQNIINQNPPLIITHSHLSRFSTASCTLHNNNPVLLDSFNQCRLVLKHWQLATLLQHALVHVNILMLLSVLIQVILTCRNRFLDHKEKCYCMKTIQMIKILSY